MLDAQQQPPQSARNAAGLDGSCLLWLPWQLSHDASINRSFMVRQAMADYSTRDAKFPLTRPVIKAIEESCCLGAV